MEGNDITSNDFTDEIPSEFVDEDKWFRFLTKPMLVIACICLAFTFFAAKISKALFGAEAWVWIIGVALTIICEVLMVVPYKGSNVLSGGGDPVLIMLAKKVYRNKNRIIYVKGIINKK